MKKSHLGATALLTLVILGRFSIAQTAAQIAPPTGLQPSSGAVFPASTTAVSLSWNAVSGAAGYLLRAQDLTDSTLRYSGNTDNSQMYVYIDGYQGTSFSMPVVSGHSYNFWMHAMTANFSYSDPSSFSTSVSTSFSVSSTTANVIVNRSLAASTTSVPPGGSLTVSVTDIPAAAADWVAVALVGSTATHIPGYWLFLNGSQTAPSSGISTATLTFAMPPTAGQYEFRLYSDNSGNVLARSAPITVGMSSTPPPVTTLIPSSTNVATGASVTVNVTDSSSTPGDWVAVALVGSTATHIPGYWLYLNGSQTAPATALTSASLTFTMPTTAGQYEFRLYANDTFTRIATSVAINVGASSTSTTTTTTTTTPTSVHTLLPAPTSVPTSGTVTVSVSDVPSMPGDWVGIAPVGSTATHIPGYWLYLNGLQTAPSSALTSATLTFTMPPTAGQYEFRLYANDTFTLLTRSGPVTVGTPTTVTAVRTLLPQTSTASPGGTLNLNFTDNPSTVGDWVGIAPAGSTTTYLPGYWLYLGGTQTHPSSPVTSGTLSFTMPTTAGQYEFRLFGNDTFNLLATSAPVTVAAPSTTSPPSDVSAVRTVTPTTTTVSAGGAVTVNVTDSPSQPADWVAIAAAGSTTTHIPGYWLYLNGTQTAPASAPTSATLTFAMPLAAGQYEFRLYANDTSTLLAKSAPVTVTSTAPFPLQIASNRKYLVDQNGQPFMIVGDTAWSVEAQVTQSDVSRYLDDRKSRGFNTILLELMEHLYTTHTPSWANAYGQLPFSNNNDFTTVNSSYLGQVDWIVQQALSRNMLVFIFPAYWGSNPGVNGWGAEMKANGVAKLTSYGQYLGNRYRAYPNIVWVHGGDWLPSTIGSPSELDLVSAIANGIISAGGGQLHTAHWKDHSDSIPGLPWLSLDSSYTYYGLHTYSATLAHAAMESGVRPCLFMEGTYENTYNSDDPSANTTEVLRAQMYQPILSGQMGFFLGNTPVWYYGNPGDGNPGWPAAIDASSGWVSALSSRGANSATVAGAFFSSIPWHQLYPDTAHFLALAGYGSFGADNYALAALSSDRRLGVIYYTASQTVTVNLAAMAGPFQARWFDPATGSYTSISGSPFANSGTRTFTPPGTNGDGSTDWVLLLQSN